MGKFRWEKHNKDGVTLFMGVARHHAWRVWRVDDETISFDVLSSFADPSTSDQSALLRDYFQVRYRGTQKHHG